METSSRSVRSDDTVHFVFDATHPLYVWDVGYHRTPPSHCYGPAVRPYYLIHLVEEGEGWVERNGQRTYLQAGDAFVIYPDEVVTYQSDERNPWTYAWIAFFGDFASSVMQGATTRLFPRFRKSGLLALKSSIEGEICDQIAALKVLFSVLDAIKSERKKEEKDVVSQAVQTIENNYFRNLDVSSLARSLHVSRAHFTTVFTQKIGESPYSYLTKIRIRKAEEFLTATSLSVTEIAYSVGFSSIERFSEMFKKYTSLSPLAYRKQKSENA